MRMKFDAEYVPCDIGWEFWCKEGNALPDRTVEGAQGHDLRSLRRDHQQAAGRAKEELSPELKDKRLTLLLADRGAAAAVQSAHEHAAVQKLSRQSVELSRQQDHKSRAVKM